MMMIVRRESMLILSDACVNHTMCHEFFILLLTNRRVN